MSSKIVVQSLLNSQVRSLEPYLSMIDRTEQLDEPYELSEAEGAYLHLLSTLAYMEGRGDEMARTTTYLAKLSNHNEDFVAMMIHFVSESGDKKLMEEVKRIIPQTIHEGVLAFNVACVYAKENNREKLLDSVRVAMDLGKTADEFFEDEAFNGYHEDKAFLAALGVE